MSSDKTRKRSKRKKKKKRKEKVKKEKFDIILLRGKQPFRKFLSLVTINCKIKMVSAPRDQVKKAFSN
jgi:hypothetical protein